MEILRFEKPSRPKSTIRPKKLICIPVDESYDSEEAIDWAMNNIVDPETDQIVLLNVRPEAFAYDPLFWDQQAELEFDKFNTRYSHALLRKYIRIVRTYGAHVFAIALRGDTLTELVWKINELGPDIVVFGHQDRVGTDCT